MRSLFIEPKGVVSPAAVAAECSATVEWNDMDLDEPVRGPAAVQALLRASSLKEAYSRSSGFQTVPPPEASPGTERRLARTALACVE